MRKKLIFDLDGTLVNSVPDIAEGMNIFLQRKGLPFIEEKDVKLTIGKGAEVSLKKLLALKNVAVSEEEFGKLYAEYIKIYQEKESAVKERPVLKEVMLMLREGDVLVVWKLDRLARSLKQLILFLEELRTRKIEFLSLSDNINSLSAQSILYTQIIGAFAQFERELMIERTLAGLEDAKRRGVKLGRRPGLTEDAKIKADAVAKLYSNGMQVLEICKILQISRGTFYRYLKYNNINLRLTRNDE